MPYNTRRKSLSLPSLGIHLPVTHAERAAANRTPPSTAQQQSATEQQPPSKKMKRSHDASASPLLSPPAKRPSLPKTVVKYEHTPPPSPEAEDLSYGESERKIDFDSIHDEIVEAVLVQLQKTGNRPHLVKELAAILSPFVRIVEMSANPSAIISSRLAGYLKRPCWNASNPCPLAKELETVHPRRTYFYLTTCRHQPIPDPAQSAAISETIRLAQRSIISPSLSSESRSDEADAERRRELSPSPEVDLSSPEFDDDVDDSITPLTPTGSYSGRLAMPPPASTSTLARNHRGASPPLEKDEKEFTQTARGMQKRKLSEAEDITMIDAPTKRVDASEKPPAEGEVEDSLQRNMEVADALFGRFGSHLHANPATHFASSPMVKPSLAVPVFTRKPFEEDFGLRLEGCGEWDLRSPENIELDELDGLLSGF